MVIKPVKLPEADIDKEFKDEVNASAQYTRQLDDAAGVEAAGRARMHNIMYFAGGALAGVIAVALVLKAVR